MKPPQDPAFRTTDVLKLFSQYRWMMVLGTALSLLLFMTAAQIIPRKYKSFFVLTVYAKYFQNPLIRDLVPEVSDAAEMKSQREALIRQSLTPDFLDALDLTYGLYRPAPGPPSLQRSFFETIERLRSLGEKWGLFQPQAAGTGNSAARQELLARIQVLNLSNMTFQVSFTDSDPSVTLKVTEDIYAQVARVLLETRTKNLVVLRNAIRKRLESISFNMASAPDPRSSLRPELLKEELADVRNQLRALGAQYTDEHPLITELREREAVLVRWLDAVPRAGANRAADPGEGFVEDKSGASAREMFNDLSRKLDYLNIALESDKAMQEDYFSVLVAPLAPKAPLWPKKRLFALWGFAGGLFASLFLAVVRNYFEHAELHVDGLADRLGVPLLGSLPHFPGRRLQR